MALKGDYGILFWIHLLFIILAYISPFTIKWPWIMVAWIYFIGQTIIVGHCWLTTWQFNGEKKVGFGDYYWRKLGINCNKKLVSHYANWIGPTTIFFFALFWQLYLKKDLIIF
jgi:hypothetical protein